MTNKKGFTLIEAVICIALIAIVSAAFMGVTVGSLQINLKGNEYDAKTAALFTAAETGEIPSTMVREEIGAVWVDLENGDSMAFNEFTLRYKEDDKGIFYHEYYTYN